MAPCQSETAVRTFTCDCRYPLCQYAIGYASFGVANQNEGKVTPLKVNGVAATKENILDGSYIIQRPLLLVGSGDPTDVQQAFLDYVLGDEGQKTVEDMGFIPMK